MESVLRMLFTVLAFFGSHATKQLLFQALLFKFKLSPSCTTPWQSSLLSSKSRMPRTITRHSEPWWFADHKECRRSVVTCKLTDRFVGAWRFFSGAGSLHRLQGSERSTESLASTSNRWVPGNRPPLFPSRTSPAPGRVGTQRIDYHYRWAVEISGAHRQPATSWPPPILPADPGQLVTIQQCSSDLSSPSSKAGALSSSSVVSDAILPASRANSLGQSSVAYSTRLDNANSLLFLGPKRSPLFWEGEIWWTKSWQSSSRLRVRSGDWPLLGLILEGIFCG